MTKTRRITPHEWIQDYFSPVVSVLSSPEAESLARTNNLSVTELVQPFSKLSNDITLKDPEGTNHSVSGLAVQFEDWRRDPARLVGSKLVSDTVNHVHDEPVVTRDFGDGTVLEAPGFTPWFDCWMKLTMAAVPAGMDHEFIRCSLGCVFVVAAGQQNLVEALRNLSQTQYKHQHEGSGKGGPLHNNYPHYVTPNILKYYVVLHDAHKVDESKAQEGFTQVQSAFGTANCSLLQINSAGSEPALKPDPAVSEHWLKHCTSTHRFSTVETRLASVVGTTTTLIPNSTPPPTQHNNHVPPSSGVPSAVDHPLALDEDDSNLTGVSSSNSKSSSGTPAELSKLLPATSSNTAIYLNTNDLERIKQFVRDFAIKGLIPHVEKQLRTLHEIVTNRKGRSLFNVGVKRWFGQSRPGAASGTSVIYGKDATELQMRKLGDLYFMFKLYKHAFNCYHTAKKDFQSDEAWNYYAGAAEMSAISQFMQNDPMKKYPAHYMEDSITKYLSVCQMPEFAVRATLFDALCLKYHGMFQEAALSYIRMTNENKDLRSGLLLEQAAYCYLLCSQPYVRKYAFYVILAGFRFSKSGQKHHSSRVYGQGYQIYKGLDWSLSEDHILYSLGHQSLLLKDSKTAASIFNELLSMDTPHPNPTQQMCHLREFFIVHHDREKKEKKIAEIPIPNFDPQNCTVELLEGGGDKTATDAEKLSFDVDTNWLEMERLIIERISGQEVMFMSKTSQAVFGPRTSNGLKPQATVGEPVKILLPVRNAFLTPLMLRKIHLVWKFTSEDGKIEATNFGEGKTPGHEKFVKSTVLENVLLEKSPGANNQTSTVLELSYTPMQVGEVEIVGVEYRLNAQFPQSETTDHTIHGRQLLSVRGPRLASTKEHKTKVVYGPDRRLSHAVLPDRPCLNVEFKSPPESLLAGEVAKLEVVMTNTSKTGGYISNIHLVHTHPGMLSLTGRADSRRHNKSVAAMSNPNTNNQVPFDYPVVSDQCLNQTLHDGSVLENRLDILPSVVCPDIPAGKSVKISLWVHGRCKSDSPTKIFLDTYFYYEYSSEPTLSTATPSSGKRPNYRITRSRFSCQVFPSIKVSAAESAACVYNNNPGSALVVDVSNGGGASVDAARVKGRQLSEVHVSQISLLSNRLNRLDSVLSQSADNDEVPVISKGESANYCLATTIFHGDTSSPDNAITVSGVRWKATKPCGYGGGGSGGEVSDGTGSDALFMDFLKDVFNFEGKAKKPVLRRELVVVSWMGKLASNGSGDSSVQGQTCVFVERGEGGGSSKVTSNGLSTLDAVDSVHTGVSDIDVDEAGDNRHQGGLGPHLWSALKVTANNESRMSHDFRSHPLASIPFQVVVENPTSEGAAFAYKVSSCDDTPSSSVFVGCTQANLTVPANQTKTLKFQVNVSSPGIYCFQGAFRFQALDSERNAHEFSWDEAVLIPLQISFLLEDSSIVHT